MENDTGASSGSNEQSHPLTSEAKPNRRYSKNRTQAHKSMSQIRYTDRVFVPKNRPNPVQPTNAGSPPQNRANDSNGGHGDTNHQQLKGEGRGNNRRKRGPKKPPVNVDTSAVLQSFEQGDSNAGDKPPAARNPRGPRQKPPRQQQLVEDGQQQSDVKPAGRGRGGGRGQRQNGRGGDAKGDSKRPPQQEGKLYQNWSRGKPDTSEHTDMASRMIQTLSKNAYECMVCTEKIQRNQTIWHCTRCFAIFHHTCIKQWSRKSKEAKEENARQLNKSGPKQLEWSCPHCNDQNRGPPKSRCFCGKVTNPEFNPYITPHSCGETCGRMRDHTDCPHPCQLPCHPGSCPPCSLMGKTRYCHCGFEEYRLRCGQPDPGRSCGRMCGKPLPCRRHKCAAICHPGACEGCRQPMKQKCYCGKQTEERICGTDTIDASQGEERHFSCGKICDRMLDCGNHRCKEKCHPGDCKECVMLPQNVLTCPCGASDVLFLGPPRISCLDPIPTCSKVCGKVLHCGQHACTKTCHLGRCPPCTKKVTVKCRCGAEEAAFDCVKVTPPPSEEGETEGEQREPFSFQCERQCQALRVCGRHRCTIKCCPARKGADPMGAHICQIPCNKTLKCGVHKCKLLCHKGRCPPCREASFDDLPCSCGKTVMSAPIPCGSVPPICDFPCHRVSACGHPLPPHKCHTDRVPCPPCTVLVEKMCMGEHEKRRNIMCHLKDISCGTVCGKPLPCGLHKCNRTCHRPPCFVPTQADAASSNGGNDRRKDKEKEKEKETEKEKEREGAEESVEKEKEQETEKIVGDVGQAGLGAWHEGNASKDERPSCGQVCGAPLRTCSHTCAALCHPNRPCPNVVCQRMVTIYCPCKRRFLEVVCMRGGEDYKVEEGDEDARVEKRQLTCNENCEREKRNQRLAEAFGTRASAGAAPAILPEELLASAKVNTLRFIQEVEKVFENLINSESERQYSFKPMKKPQRKLVHELAAYYSVDAQSFDPEPNRNVVVTKRLESRIPQVLLSTALSSGQSVSTVTKNRNLPASYDEFYDSESTSTLHIYDLTLDVKTEHLASFLSPFAGDYTLRWVDPYNALAIFDDPEKYRLALQILGKEDKNNIFKVKPYQIPPSSWLIKRRQQQAKTAPPPATKPPPKPNPWKIPLQDSDKKPDTTKSNAFSVLDTAGGVPDPFAALPTAAAPLLAPVKERWDDEDDAPTTVSSAGGSWKVVTEKVAPPLGKEGKQWSCTMCTFLNEPRTSKCAMCEAPNPLY